MEFQSRTENKSQQQLRVVYSAADRFVSFLIPGVLSAEFGAEFGGEIPVERAAGHGCERDVGTVAQGGEGVEKKRTIIRRAAGASGYGSEDRLGDASEEGLFVGEMPVQGAGRDVEGAGEPPHREVGKAVLLQNVDGGTHDFLAV